MSKVVVFVLLLFQISCFWSKEKKNPFTAVEIKADSVVIQPFDSFSGDKAEALAEQLIKRGLKIRIAEAILLPASAWYAPRKRYRADSLIAYLQRRTPEGKVTIGLTHKDISSSNETYADFGIMGLGFKPGKACVVSTFRIKGQNKKEKIGKVVIHEFGHTRGLSHCPVKTCLMRDAEGKDHLNEETGFCKKCRSILKEKGYPLKNI